MNIQIFGKPKCFDTAKAERYFKERNIPFQRIDVAKYGISKGAEGVCAAVGGLTALLDDKAKGPSSSATSPMKRIRRQNCWKIRSCCAPHRPQRQKGHDRLLPRCLG